MTLFQYLDDWLNANCSRKGVARNTKLLVIVCQRLGLLVNREKSELIPIQSIVFLGESLEDGERASVSIARQPVCGPESDYTRQLRFAEAESLLGLLTATYPTIPLGRLHLRSLQQQVITQIRKGRSAVSDVQVREDTKDHLRWWLSNYALKTGVPFLCTGASAGDRHGCGRRSGV